MKHDDFHVEIWWFIHVALLFHSDGLLVLQCLCKTSNKKHFIFSSDFFYVKSLLVVKKIKIAAFDLFLFR